MFNHIYCSFLFIYVYESTKVTTLPDGKHEQNPKVLAYHHTQYNIFFLLITFENIIKNYLFLVLVKTNK